MQVFAEQQRREAKERAEQQLKERQIAERDARAAKAVRRPAVARLLARIHAPMKRPANLAFLNQLDKGHGEIAATLTRLAARRHGISTPLPWNLLTPPV